MATEMENIVLEAPRTNEAVFQGIKDAYAKEQANPQKATKYGDIPETYESITSEWLTAILGKDVPGAEVVSFELGPKDNGTANRRRIHSIEWNDVGKKAGLPTSVFCKATQSLLNRLQLSFGGIDAEVAFFNDIRPLVDIEAPVAYYATYDPVSYNSISVLKDMTGVWTFLNYKHTSSRDDVEQQLRLLAKLHGQYWMSKRPEATGRITFRQGFHGYVLTSHVESACTIGFKESKDTVPPALYARVDEIWPATVISYERNGRMPYTLAHGDLHLGNWYKTPEGKIGVTDFQCLSRGFYARDIAYVISTSPPIPERRKWDKDLVKFYLAELKAAGGPEIPFESAWLELRLQLFTVLAYWTLTLTPDDRAMPQMQADSVSAENIKRISTMMQDVDSLEAASHFKPDGSAK